MGKCGCGHCDCDNEDDKKQEENCDCNDDCDCNHNHDKAQKKIEALKKAIVDLGYTLEETEDGIRIIE